MAISRNRETFPIWVHKDLDDLKLDPFAMRVYVHLARRANGSGKAWPSRESIAEHCGMSEKQVTRCVQVLEDEGLVVVVRGTRPDGGRANTYWLTSTDEWLQKAVAKRNSQGGVGTVSPDVPPGGGDCESPGVGTVSPFAIGEKVNQKEGKPQGAQAPVSPPEVPSKAKGSKRKTAPDPKSFLALFPDEFRHDDAFVEAWAGWGQNRIEDKNPLNERAAVIARNKLVKFPIKIGIEALERATMGNWTGVFPESIAPGGKSGKFSEASGEQPPQDFGF